MPKLPVTEAQITMAICYAVMRSWDFNYQRRLEWEVWASKHQACSECGARANFQCRHKTDIKRLIDPPRLNKRPHDSRVDWDRLLQGLKQRGYYRPVIERQIRKQVPHDS